MSQAKHPAKIKVVQVWLSLQNNLSCLSKASIFDLELQYNCSEDEWDLIFYATWNIMNLFGFSIQ